MPYPHKGTIAVQIKRYTLTRRHVKAKRTHTRFHTCINKIAFSALRAVKVTLLQAHSLGCSPSATHVQNSCRVKAFSLSPVVKPKRKLRLRSTVSNTPNQKWLIIHKQPISLLHHCCHVTNTYQFTSQETFQQYLQHNNIQQCTVLFQHCNLFLDFENCFAVKFYRY